MRTRVMSKTTPTDYERSVKWHSICTFSCQTHYNHIKTAGGNQKNKNIDFLPNLISVPTLRRACAIVMQLIFNLFRFHMSDAQINENIRPRNFLSPLFIFSVRRHRNQWWLWARHVRRTPHIECSTLTRCMLALAFHSSSRLCLVSELPTHSSIVAHCSAVFCRQQFRARHTLETEKLAKPSVRLPPSARPVLCVAWAHDDGWSALLR